MANQKEDKNLVFKADYRLMQVKNIAECSFIKLPFVIKICVFSIFDWPLKTGFTLFDKIISMAIILLF